MHVSDSVSESVVFVSVDGIYAVAAHFVCVMLIVLCCDGVHGMCAGAAHCDVCVKLVSLCCDGVCVMWAGAVHSAGADACDVLAELLLVLLVTSLSLSLSNTIRTARPTSITCP